MSFDATFILPLTLSPSTFALNSFENPNLLASIPAGADGLRGVGGGGRDGLGGLDGLKPPFATNGESLPLVAWLSLELTSSLLSGPCMLFLQGKQKTQIAVTLVILTVSKYYFKDKFSKLLICHE